MPSTNQDTSSEKDAITSKGIQTTSLQKPSIHKRRGKADIVASKETRQYIGLFKLMNRPNEVVSTIAFSILALGIATLISGANLEMQWGKYRHLRIKPQEYQCNIDIDADCN